MMDANMKIRTDFVTNSSSSSFIIAYRPTKSKLHNRIVQMIIELESYFDTRAANVVKDKQSLDKQFIAWYGSCNDTIHNILKRDVEVREEYNRCIDRINEGYQIICKCIGYGDSTLQDLIRLLSENNNNFIPIGDEYED